MAGNHLQAAMASLNREDESTDLSVVVGDVTLKAHGIILAARSPFFKTAINTAVGERKGEVMLEGRSEEVVRVAIDFMYGVDIKDTFTDYTGLFDIAQFLLMSDLKEEAEKLIVKKTKITGENILRLSRLAETYQARLLAEKCALFLLRDDTGEAPGWAGVIAGELMREAPGVVLASMRLARETLRVVREGMKCGCGVGCGEGRCERLQKIKRDVVKYCIPTSECHCNKCRFKCGCLITLGSGQCKRL